MTRRRLLFFLIFTIIFSLTFSSFKALAENPSRPIKWKELIKGLDFALLDAGQFCRKGNPNIAAVKINPDCLRFDIFYYKENPEKIPLTIAQWQNKTRAIVIFNAGQYDEGNRPIGLFYHGSRNFGMSLHKYWKALFVAEPEPGLRPLADVIDSELTPFQPAASPYKLAAQSFMLIDANGKKRVRESDWVANRTILAADHDKKILVLVTEGGYTLWELAEFISKSGLNIKHAMSLDGGFQAELCIKTESFNYVTYGSYSTQGEDHDRSMPGYQIPLPAVIAVFERPEPVESCRPQ